MSRVFIILFSFLLLVFGCQKAPETKPKGPLRVLVTIAPYAEFVKTISNDEVDVITLLPPGSNLHTYEPSPSLVSKLSNVDLWVQIGETFEKQIEAAMISANPQLKILDMSQKIPLLPFSKETKSFGGCGHHHEGRDLHIWMGPKNAPSQVRLIAESMISLDRAHQKTYLDGMNNLIHELETLDRDLSIELAPYANSAILVSHPSLGYFCENYHLKQISIECEGKAPRPQDLEAILEEARDLEALCIFTQAGFDNRGATLIAQKLSIPTFELDPYAPGYFDNMHQIGKNIAEAGQRKKT